MSIKPWICNGSRTICKGRWIDLHADDCALPDGTKISPFYVNDVPDFVVVVAVTVDGTSFSCASTAMERDRSF